jgi:hypothetical protein
MGSDHSGGEQNGGRQSRCDDAGKQMRRVRLGTSHDADKVPPLAELAM